MSETMKAIRIHQYGGPEELVYEDAPKPTPGPGDVLVKVLAAGVNPVDWKIRAGYAKGGWPLTFPSTIGFDIAGVVSAIGEGVTDWAPGDAVYADSPHPVGYAEYAVVAAPMLAKKPESLTFVDAASLPVAILTAWQGVFDHGHLETGQSILIHAASGGVGMFAVQFAHWCGAEVIGTASAHNEEFVRSLGADTFIDYHAAPFEKALTEKVDIVFDAVGVETATRSLSVIRPGGILVCIAGAPSAEEADKHGVHLAKFMAKAGGKQLKEIGDLFDAGEFQAHVSTIFPLSEARAAHEHIQTGRTRGKIVLHIAGE